MGGGIIEAGMAGCTGHDVLKALDDVFGHPNSKEYQNAKEASQGLFEGVGVGAGNWQDLYAAYKAAYAAAEISICDNWEPYLQTLSPDDIYLIAQARSQGLVMNWTMTTKTHNPTKGGHHVTVSNGAGSIIIDSPYSATFAYRNQKRNRNRKR